MLHHLLHDQSIPARLLQQNGSPNQDGERQLTNLLHLGDLLQTASLGLQGEGALLRYLEDQLRRPKGSGDMAQLRLESDANLVQVITVHKAKGLQYPLVFLPFVSSYRVETTASDKDDALRLEEDIRLLYVALTRAEQALWVGLAPMKGDVDGNSPKPKSAVSRLLGRQVSGDLAACIKAWETSPHIMVQTAPKPDRTPYTPEAPDAHWKPARIPRRQLVSRWWSASFSALTRDVGKPAAPAFIPASERDERVGDAQIDNTPAPDDLGDSVPQASLPDQALEAVALPFNEFKAGNAYGTLLHDLLEWQADNGWPASQHSPDASVDAAWRSMLVRKA